MKLILTLALFLLSMTVSAQKDSTNNQVLKYTSGPYREINWPNHTRTTLVKIERTMMGQKHSFVTDSSVVVVLFLRKRLEVNECYMVPNLFINDKTIQHGVVLQRDK